MNTQEPTRPGRSTASQLCVVIEGSGSIWLGNQRKDFKPGTLLIMPKGTPHGGALVTSNGPVKALAIKLPPWRSDDTQVVD